MASWRVLAIESELTFYGGQERSYADVCAGLAERGHHIELAYRTGGDAEPAWAAITDHRHRIESTMIHPNALLASSVGFARSARRAIAIRPDVVYVNQYQDTPLAALVAARHRVPLVCHLRQPVPRRYGVQWAAALPRVAYFIAVSHHTREEFVRSGLPAERVIVVHLGVETDSAAPDAARRARGRKELGLTEPTPMVLYAGRLDREKGLEILLDAWRRVVANEPAARLVVLGGPRNHPSSAAAAAYVEELRARAGEGVIWRPRRTDVSAMHAAADVVVVPSVYAEPGGRVVFEAMAAGVPVVASRVGGLPEVCEPFPELLVPPGDPGALAATLLRTVRWRSQQPSLGERCRAHVIARFPVRATVDGVEAVLASALSPAVDALPRLRRAPLWRWGRRSS